MMGQLPLRVSHTFTGTEINNCIYSRADLFSTLCLLAHLSGKHVLWLLPIHKRTSGHRLCWWFDVDR